MMCMVEEHYCLFMITPSLVPRPFSYGHAREGKEGSGK